MREASSKSQQTDWYCVCSSRSVRPERSTTRSAASMICCRTGARRRCARRGWTVEPRLGTILELGFGTGHGLAALARAVGPTGAVFGLDLPRRWSKLAKDRLAKAGLLERCQLRRGDATALPYPPDALDAVFMSFTLELFDTPEIPSVLGECKRVLRPGGRIVVVGMSKDGPGERLVKALSGGTGISRTSWIAAPSTCGRRWRRRASGEPSAG